MPEQHRGRRALLPCLAAVGLVYVLGASAALRSGPERPKVGVITMRAVLDRYEKWKDMKAMLLQRRELRTKEIDKLAGEVDGLKEELSTLEAESADFLRKQGDLIQKEAVLQATSQQYEIELTRSEERQYGAIMEEIGSVVAELAVESGLTVVLQRVLEVPEGMWESVLYADQRADLTDRLVDRLNARYKREKEG